MVGFAEKESPMNEYEWRKIGGQNKRLHIPLPPSREGLFNLAHMIEGLTLQLRELAKTPGKNAVTMLTAGSLISLCNLRLKDLAAEWEAELHEAKVPSLGGARLNIRRPDSGDEGGK